MSEHPLETMVRDFQDRIVSGTFAGVRELGEDAHDRVMECQAASCAVAFAELYQIPAELELDGFIEKMRMGGSSKLEIEQQDGALIWRELHSGQCVCPLVTRDVIPLDPGLCRCAEHWLRKLLERHARGPVRVEIVESAALGHENCVFRVEIDDRSHP